MKIADYPRFCHEVYAVHESLLRFGFKPEDIYVAVNNIIGHGENIFCVELRAQDKRFVIPMVPCKDGKSRMIRQWTEFVNLVADPSTTDRELDESFRSTVMGRDVMNMAVLAGTLSKRGFVVPSLSDGGKSMEALGEDPSGLSKGGNA